MAYRNKLPRTFEKFDSALKRLQESLSEKFGKKYDDKDVLVEIVVKRFEYTFECMWKTLKEILLAEGIDSATPLSAFKAAFRMGLIDEKHEEVFPLIVKKRNEVVHIYSDEDAQEIYLMIRNIFLEGITSLHTNLKRKM